MVLYNFFWNSLQGYTHLKYINFLFSRKQVKWFFLFNINYARIKVCEFNMKTCIIVERKLKFFTLNITTN